MTALKERRAKSIACGAYHTGVVLYGGTLFTWGSGSDGELGHGRKDNETLPREVRGLVAVEMRLRPQSQDKAAPTSSVQVSTPLLFSHVSCGGYHSAAIAQNSTLYTWGYGGDGQLGQGHDMTVCSPHQVLPPNPRP